MQDGEHRAVADGIEEADALPRAFQRTGLRLPVAHDRRHEQIGVVERCAERVRQHVTQLAAFMDGPRGRRADVARHSTGRRKLAKQPQHAGGVLSHLGIDLAPRSLQPRIGDGGGSTVARANQQQHVLVAAQDQPVEMRPDQVYAGRRAPMPEQSRLDVFRAQRFAQQRVRLQVDLPNGEEVCRPPPGVQELCFVCREHYLVLRH